MPTTPRQPATLVLRLQAQVAATVLEGGADLAALDLLVLVVGQAAAQADLLDAGEGIQVFGAQVRAMLRSLT